MVFCGLFPTDNDQFETMRDSLGKLQLNDAALVYEPEVHPSSSAPVHGIPSPPAKILQRRAVWVSCWLHGLMHMLLTEQTGRGR